MVDAATSSETHGAINSVSEDLVSTAVLGVAALAATYSGWQASLWSGQQSRFYSEVNIANGNATRLAIRANTEISYDAASTIQLAIVGMQRPDEAQKLADHVIRSEFRPFFEEWMATRPFATPNAPRTPFVLPSYRNATSVASQTSVATADAMFDKGNRANVNSDAFALTTVIASFTLFFAGLAPKPRRRRLRWVLISFAIVALVVTSVRILTLPRA